KRCPASHKFVDAPVVVYDSGGYVDVLSFSFENDSRFVQGRGAIPFFDDSRISGASEGTGAEVCSYIDGFVVSPGSAGLGFRQEESIGAKFLCVQVKFPHDDRTCAAAGKKNKRAIVSRSQHIRALPNPVLIFGRPACPGQAQSPMPDRPSCTLPRSSVTI